MHTNVFAKKIASCISLQLPINSYIYIYIYIYISIFSKIGYRSVITVHTNLFAKNCKLHKKKLFPQTTDGQTDGRTDRCRTRQQ